MTVERHDFRRPWARHRKRVYLWSSVAAALIAGVPILLVGLGVLPMEPTGSIAAVAICGPIIAPMVVAWWDAPLENRTLLEKANEFMIVWFPITAASQVLWEFSWLASSPWGRLRRHSLRYLWWSTSVWWELPVAC